MVDIRDETVTEVVTGFGVKGVSAERVASDACDEAERYLGSAVPVGSHLADQLLMPMALGRGGTFRTLTPSAHALTNAAVIRALSRRRCRVRPGNRKRLPRRRRHEGELTADR